jgi:hypothetical protein
MIIGKSVSTKRRRIDEEKCSTGQRKRMVKGGYAEVTDPLLDLAEFFLNQLHLVLHSVTSPLIDAATPKLLPQISFDPTSPIMIADT